jgi:tetratricopeptide (TPR) repeat protein
MKDASESAGHSPGGASAAAPAAASSITVAPSKADEALRRANEAIDAGAWPLALQTLEEADAIEPGRGDVLVRMAQTHGELGNCSTVMSLAVNGIRSCAEGDRARLLEAAAKAAAGAPDPELCLERLDDAIEQIARDRDRWRLAWAQALELTERPQEASARFARFEGVFRPLFEHHLFLANSKREDDRAGAVAAYREAIACAATTVSNEQVAEAHASLATLLMEDGRAAEALPHAVAAFRGDEGHTDLLLRTAVSAKSLDALDIIPPRIRDTIWPTLANLLIEAGDITELEDFAIAPEPEGRDAVVIAGALMARNPARAAELFASVLCRPRGDRPSGFDFTQLRVVRTIARAPNKHDLLVKVLERVTSCPDDEHRVDGLLRLAKATPKELTDQIALEACRRAALAAPGRSEPYTLVAEVLFPSRQRDAALWLGKLFAAMAPESRPVARTKWASALADVPTPKEAIREFENARKEGATGPDIDVAHAAALRAANRSGEALAMLRRANEQFPDALDVRLELAEALALADDARGSADHYAAAIEKAPERADLYGRLAGVLAKVDLAEEVVGRLRPVAEAQTTDDVRAAWVGVLVAARAWDEVVLAQAEVIRRAPHRLESYSDGLETAIRQLDPGDAILQTLQAVVAECKSAFAHFLLGRLLLMGVDLPDMAAVELEQASKEYGGADLLWYRAKALVTMNRPEEADPYFEAGMRSTFSTFFDLGHVHRWAKAESADALVSKSTEEVPAQKAIARYRELSQNGERDATNFWARFSLAIVLDRMHRKDEALEKYREIQGLFPGHPYPTHNITEILTQQGLYAKARDERRRAIKEYEEARADPSRVAKTIGGLGAQHYAYEALMRRADLQSPDAKEVNAAYDQIRALCDLGLRDEPNHTPLLAILATLGIQDRPPQALIQGRELVEPSRAWAAYRRAVRVLERRRARCESVGMMLELGKLHLVAGEIAQATEAYQKAISLDTLSLAEAQVGLGVARARAGDHAEAIRRFEAALRREPQNLEAWSNLAETCMKAERLDRARREYEAILQIAPHHIDSLLGLGELCVVAADAVVKSDPDAASKFYRESKDYFERAHACRDGSGAQSQSLQSGKSVSAKDEGALLYHLGYVATMRYEVEGRDEGLLREARRYFRGIPRTHETFPKAKTALERIEERLSPLKSLRADRLAPGLAVLGAVVVFVLAQIAHFVPVAWEPAHYTITAETLDRLASQNVSAGLLGKLKPLGDNEVEAFGRAKMRALVIDKLGADGVKQYGNAVDRVVDASSVESGWHTTKGLDASFWVALTFGSLGFMLAGLYARQLVKLKLGPIEIEKTTIDRITATPGLGISR